ncbi:MAG: COR domain-containing protein [Candidatus Thiodiazotropha sp.]
MKEKSRLERIATHELPELLIRLGNSQTTELALIGRNVRLSTSQDNWPKVLQGHVVYQLTDTLSELPRELFRLERLQFLALQSLNLHFADAVAIAEHLGQITSLDLWDNKVGDAGARAIARHLGQLTSLSLWNNKVGDVGARAIAEHLGQLTSLDLSSNKVGEFGARAIAEHLGQLTSLDLWGNEVGDAGARAIAKHLGQLTSLDLSSNEVGEAGARAIAEHLGQLTSLDLWGNEVGDAGARAIAEHLGQLTSLNLWSNGVGETGARAIAEHLGQLTSLDLWDNKVGDAGARAIAEHLGQLTSLSLWNNEVGDAGARAIAEHLGQLTSLNLSHNKVGDAGARAIAEHLGQLTSLNLSQNKVGDAGVRAIAEHLGQLTSLNLSHNKVGVAGARAIAEHLGQLTSLNLSQNKVGDAGVRAIAEHLGQLTSLNLSHNKVGVAGARAIAEHLEQLTSLSLESNEVGDETVELIGEHLTDIATLDLSGNKRITTIAPLAHLSLLELNIAKTNVSDLSPLKSLVLDGLPVEWDIFGMSGIYVEHCPLKHPSPEIIKQGPEAVLNYFGEIEIQGVDRLFEAKLLIVGEGGAGKTSLLRRLYKTELTLPTEDETTRGIDIYRHEFPISNERVFRLNIWDFGGQQIYHATHQFFLTKRSLYVLVDDTRSDHRSIHDEGFKFWLEVVETLSEGSPLLIFQNEKGGRSKQIDEAGIKGRFPNIQAIHHGNLEHPGSADSLRQAVEYHAQQLPHIGEDVPAKWVAVREELENLAKTKPYISLIEYLAVYGRHLSLDHKEDRDKALRLSLYLHDLGVFLHFQQPRELRRTVFLQNQWVTEAVFRIMDDERVKANMGRFRLTDCDRLWADQGYAEKEVELRALMVRFELSYRLPDTVEETWLVPQHLSPSKPPELNDWAKTGDLMLTYHYEFLPRGLVSRLIVRMHRLVKQPDLCWSRGALFEHRGTQVLVETATRGNEIVMRSRGPEKKALLSVIASDLDALNDSFKGLKDKVEKWVPCICDTCRSSKEPAMYNQKELIDRKSRGKPTIECPKPPDYADVGVLELLDGMNLDEWLKRAHKELLEEVEVLASFDDTDQIDSERVADSKTIRIFIASSAELREDRDAFDLYFRRQNDHLRNQGLYLEIVRWEDFLDAMSEKRLQDEYNKEIRKCDIFVSLFKTKTGKYTEEEFDVARQSFLETGKPLIYTYFRKASVSTSARNRSDLISLWNFQQKLNDLGHFHTEYESTDGLQKHFRDQLDKIQFDSQL